MSPVPDPLHDLEQRCELCREDMGATLLVVANALRLLRA